MQTRVSTEPIRAWRSEFRDALDPAQRQQATFDITSDAWRRWWNIHPFIMRHGVLLEDLVRAAARGALRLVEAP